MKKIIEDFSWEIVPDEKKFEFYENQIIKHAKIENDYLIKFFNGLNIKKIRILDYSLPGEPREDKYDSVEDLKKSFIIKMNIHASDFKWDASLFEKEAMIIFNVVCDYWRNTTVWKAIIKIEDLNTNNETEKFKEYSCLIQYQIKY